MGMGVTKLVIYNVCGLFALLVLLRLLEPDTCNYIPSYHRHLHLETALHDKDDALHNAHEVPHLHHHTVGDQGDHDGVEDEDEEGGSSQDDGPQDSGLRPTRIVAHAPGFTIFENLYVANGTFLLVGLDANTTPQTRMMISSNFSYSDLDESLREPTQDTMDLISLEDAQRKFAGGAYTIKQTSWIFHYPPTRMLASYYHGVAEAFFGAWSFYVGTYDPAVTRQGTTTAPPVSRVVFTHNGATEWRDTTGFNEYFLLAAFPSLTIETKENWESRAHMTRDADKAFVYQRVLLVDRAAAMRAKAYDKERRTAAVAVEAVKDKTSPFWWEPVRRRVLTFAGAQPEPSKDAVVLTYISRQAWSRRKLRSEDHDDLVAALEVLVARRGWELQVLDTHNMSKEDQLHAAARTTVMMGVHGNDLTHLLFMPHTPRSTVIEFFYPRSFTYDYEWTARAVGHKHFAIWNDTYYTYPHPVEVQRAFPEGVDGDGGFHGNNIPLHGPSVVRLVEKRVDGQM